jgi:hypothetical protein
VITKHRSDVLTVFSSVSGVHDTIGSIAFTAKIDGSISGSFLLTFGSIETSACILSFLSTNHKLDLTLQSSVGNGTRTEHAIVMNLSSCLPRHELVFFDSGVGSELALSMPAFSAVVAMEIATPVVGPSGGGQQQKQKVPHHGQ